MSKTSSLDTSISSGLAIFAKTVSKLEFKTVGGEFSVEKKTTTQFPNYEAA